MNEKRTVAKVLAGLLVTGVIAVGGAAPAHASDTGWNGTVAPADSPTTTTSTTTTTTSPTKVKLAFRDTGWNGT